VAEWGLGKTALPRQAYGRRTYPTAYRAITFPSSRAAPLSHGSLDKMLFKRKMHFICQTFSTRLDRGGPLGPGRTPWDPPSRVEKVGEIKCVASCEKRHVFLPGCRVIEDSRAAPHLLVGLGCGPARTPPRPPGSTPQTPSKSSLGTL